MTRAVPTCGLLWLLLVCASLGCEGIADSGGTFRGHIVDGNFVRRCFEPGTEATLVFDPERAVASTSIPKRFNRLTTTDGTFDETPLHPFTALPHDQLSALDFPGPKRVRNFLLMARPTGGPLAGRNVTVVVSILEKGSMEVRVMARTPEDDPPCEAAANEDDAPDDYVTDPHEYFGVFQLYD